MLEKSKISYLNTQTFALQNLQGMWTPTCPVQVSNLPCPGQRVFLEICPVSCPEQDRTQDRAGSALPCGHLWYKLTSEQLLTANKIRQLANNFRRNALKKIKRHSMLNKNQIETLKNLSKDKSIFITKADKGRCTVVLDRTQYIDSMESLINECTSFKLVDVDPTVSQEDKLVKKLRELKACNFISEEEYHLCYPTGSQPARMYGLPKVHKERLSFRSILAATGTFNYKLAQLLVKRLSHLRKSETIIANTFSFVDQLHSVDFNMQEHKLISFDITSLFTNIPLCETIDIILNELYPELCTCSPTKKRMKKSDKCSTCLCKANMKWLLETATSETHFYFNNKIYRQCDGVSMGSPLGPLLADIFLIDLEKKILPKFKENGVVYYKRYVDDIFAIVKQESNIDHIRDILNGFHPAIQFTSELEQDNQLPFLDIHIRRLLKHDRSWFITSIYRKPTFTGLLLKWKSFVPYEYKKCAISSMVY